MQRLFLERLDRPGGRAYSWEQHGFHFDAGPTVVTAPHCLDELFTMANKQMSDYVTLQEVDPMYRLFWEDGTVFDYVRDEATLLNNIAICLLTMLLDTSGFTSMLAKCFGKAILS